jgi:hypothetical protein
VLTKRSRIWPPAATFIWSLNIEPPIPARHADVVGDMVHIIARDRRRTGASLSTASLGKPRNGGAAAARRCLYCVPGLAGLEHGHDAGVTPGILDAPSVEARRLRLRDPLRLPASPSGAEPSGASDVIIIGAGCCTPRNGPPGARTKEELHAPGGRASARRGDGASLAGPRPLALKPQWPAGPRRGSGFLFRGRRALAGSL